MVSILFLAADPSDESRLRLGEEEREIKEKLRLSKWRNEFVFDDQTSVRPEDISQALLDFEPNIVHFSGHGASTGELYFEDIVGKTHPVQPEALAALFAQFSSHVNCVLLNACYSLEQAQSISSHIEYVIGMSQAIDDKAAIAFSIGFYQALGGGRTIKDAYQLGCVQIQMQNIAEHLTPVLFWKGEISHRFDPVELHQIRELPRQKVQTVVYPPSVERPYNLSFDGPVEGDIPLGWFNSFGYVSNVSTDFHIKVVERPGGPGQCVCFWKPDAARDEFGSLMQRCLADYLAGTAIRFQGDIMSRDVIEWAGFWLRADGAQEFNLFFDNMAGNPIRGSNPWRTYSVDASLPPETVWLNYGIVLSGSGSLWIDNLELLIWESGKWSPV